MGKNQRKVLKAYKFRIYPTKAQQKFLIQTFGCVRFTYNTLLKQRQFNTIEASKKLTPAALKKEFPFLKLTDSLALANAQRNLARAFQNYYQGRSGHPKMKLKKSTWQSYTTNNQQQTIWLKDNLLKVPKLKQPIAVVCHRKVVGKIKSATITAKNLQQFYVSLLCEEEVGHLPKTKTEIELRFAPNQLVVGNQLKFCRQLCVNDLETKLKKAKRKLEIKAKSAQQRKVRLAEAKNYQKQKLKVQKLYHHKQQQKKAWIDELTMHLIKNYDFLYVKVPKHGIEGSFTLADWQRFLVKLQYKANWYGKKVIFLTAAKTVRKIS
ncbi:RNA-guided endonuclease TnpB family protein [Enterococcus sp. S86.2]|uniref:RNA-guided endonuclease TnpB family protein n=1 Tax=Enterococcus sp. S86.2 TaxID=3031299 RepID=UPI0026F03EE0|nr:RNA-guided endonuclease TnpB family protein [Enterococcus sp. S86.2]